MIDSYLSASTPEAAMPCARTCPASSAGSMELKLPLKVPTAERTALNTTTLFTLMIAFQFLFAINDYSLGIYIKYNETVKCESE
jgi:hypothetical protein